jgi:hypothetical protein
MGRFRGWRPSRNALKIGQAAKERWEKKIYLDSPGLCWISGVFHLDFTWTQPGLGLDLTWTDMALGLSYFWSGLEHWKLRRLETGLATDAFLTS